MILLLASWTKVLVWLNSSPCAHPGTPRRFTALMAFPKASLPQHLGQSNSIIFTETTHVHHFQQSKWVMPHPWLRRAGINMLRLTREQKVGSEAGRGWCQLRGLVSEPAGHQSSPDRKWQQHVELLEPAMSSPCSQGAVPVALEMSGLEWKDVSTSALSSELLCGAKVMAPQHCAEVPVVAGMAPGQHCLLPSWCHPQPLLHAAHRWI